MFQKEKYHSRLAVFYLDQVQDLQKDPKVSNESIKDARYIVHVFILMADQMANEDKFQTYQMLFRQLLQSLLKYSTLYNASLLLSKIPENSELDLETAMLYGMVGINTGSIRDDPYWTSRENSLELIELSSINIVSSSPFNTICVS